MYATKATNTTLTLAKIEINSSGKTPGGGGGRGGGDDDTGVAPNEGCDSSGGAERGHNGGGVGDNSNRGGSAGGSGEKEISSGGYVGICCEGGGKGSGNGGSGGLDICGTGRGTDGGSSDASAQHISHPDFAIVASDDQYITPSKGTTFTGPFVPLYNFPLTTMLS
jgi:hypothetical protein